MRILINKLKNNNNASLVITIVNYEIYQGKADHIKAINNK